LPSKFQQNFLSMCLSVCHPFSALLYCLHVCVLCAFVPHLFNQHIGNLFSLWAASIDKHIASLAARHYAFFLTLNCLSYCAQLIINWLI